MSPPKPKIGRFHIAIERPEEVIPRLGKPTLHWKVGRSAHALANRWVAANNFPPRVKKLLDGDPEYRTARLVSGFFERDTDLGSAGRPSQTDLLVLASLGTGLAIIGVEGKVDEPFGDFVSRWHDGSPGRSTRLAGLCRTLGLDPQQCNKLRYQLLHRCAAAIYEAHAFHCRHALMLVHSFSPAHACFDDFRTFSHAIGLPVDEPDKLSAAKMLDSVSFRLGWVSDRPPAAK